MKIIAKRKRCWIRWLLVVTLLAIICKTNESGWGADKEDAADQPTVKSMVIVSIDATKMIHGVSMKIDYDEQKIAFEKVEPTGNGKEGMVMPHQDGATVSIGLIHPMGFPAGEAMRLTFTVQKGAPDLSWYRLKEFYVTGAKGEPLSGVAPRLQVVNE